MDEELRTAHRRWQAGEPLEGVLQAHARVGRELPDDVVRALPRWRPLVDFATRWRACGALDQEDGLPLERVRAREAALGVRLPAALREWYRLVGATLRPVQDRPVRLEALELAEGKLVVYSENQGCFHWLILEGDLGLDDPPVHGGRDLQDTARVADRLSDLLVAKVLHEAAVGDSPVGRLASTVRHGALVSREDGPPKELLDRFPILPVVSTGSPWPDELRGDADTIVRLLGRSFFHVVARTEAAWSEVIAVSGARPS